MSATLPKNAAREELAALIVRLLDAPSPVLPADELVAFPFGLEVSAARKLVRDGTLRAARIGRRVYAKRSDVVGLVDRLAATSIVANEEPRSPEDAYAGAVRRARAK